MGRASESEQTGSVGVSEATGKFGRIGFGFAEITRHDNGTDVFLMARDRRLWDLGLTMAAQIKGGPSWFKEPVRDAAGAVVGWWFRDDNGEHLQDWVDHALPHLLVMHNLEEDISYWVLVDNDAIISTGKGAKVLVPLTQRVDEHSRDALIAIASSVRVAPRWEGSAWAGATSLSQRDLVRYALIAPRLVAPHPNAGIREPLTAAQAIAMAAQVRDMEIREAVDNGNLRPLDELRRATDPGWRLFAAMLGRVRTGDAEELAQVHRGIEKSPMRAAAAASGAACLLEEGRADEAIRILEAELAQDYALPVDHAWLVVQLARACGEAGQYERARALAASFQALSVTHAEDLTATALAGAGVGILFRLSDWGSVDLENVIASSDTIVGWWRSQTRGWALGAAVAETFRTWSRDTSTRFANSDPANDQLVAAMLNATLIGDHGAWAALMQVHGMNVLSRTGRDSEPAAVKAAVDALRLGGDVKGIEKAVRRVVVDGPASAVAELADSLDLDAMTPTSVGATLTLLREAGAALSPGAAERISAWLLGVLEEPKHFVATTRPSFLLRQTLVETLSGVMQGAASTSTHEAIADAFLSRDAVTDELEARAWAGVLVRLADAAWTDARVSTARARLSDNERLRRALQQVARPRDPLARDELLAEIRRGSPEALAAWRTLHDLPADAAAEALEGLARLLEERARDASPGVTYGYTYDIGALLAQMSAVYPDAARWEELTQYLEHPSVADGNRSGPLGQLATH